MSMALMLTVLLGVDSFAQTFEQANDAYARGAYEEAARGYEALIAESIEDPAVFFNLGNAYYKQGRLGCAVANYERALRLEPGMPDARDNLGQAVMKTRRKLGAPMPAMWARNLFFWHYDIPYDTTRVLAAISWVLFWAFLGVRLWRKIPYLHGAIIAAGILAVAFGASTLAKGRPAPRAAVAVDQVAMRYGPGEQEEVVLYAPDGDGRKMPGELFDGDRVLVEARRDGWVLVAAADGARGWIPENTIVYSTPPYGEPPTQDSAPPAEAAETAS